MVDLLKTIFGPLTDLLSGTLQTFHGWGAPWWLSIIMLTVIVRTLLFPLTFKQVKSMRKMQELKPDLDEIKAKHKNDPKKQQEETMKLYGERSVNPLGGCLPVLVQMPIFITLYYTIKSFEHLESFRTGGLLWFPDLTVSDPYFILPVLYVLTMMASQEITIRNTAPEQRQLMRFLPLVFGGFLAFSGFPAGLFVYWVASNCITFTQNYVIYHRHPHTAPAKNGSEDAKGAKDTTPKPESAPKPGNEKSPAQKTTAATQNAPRSARSRNRKKKSAGKKR
ncbi:MAG TPA: membrane protein insertase YidC [Rubrobacteraceae bacterium]|nr:membrane protein insertase YidC [Rubrobacteraceae bacterium]